MFFPSNDLCVQSFILTFLAEWGDRSQIATIAVRFFIHCKCTCSPYMSKFKLAGLWSGYEFFFLSPIFFKKSQLDFLSFIGTKIVSNAEMFWNIWYISPFKLKMLPVFSNILILQFLMILIQRSDQAMKILSICIETQLTETQHTISEAPNSMMFNSVKKMLTAENKNTTA